MKEKWEETQFLQSEQYIYGERLKTARALAHLSAKEVSERANLSASKISRIENSWTYTVSDEELNSLAFTINVAPSWFLTKPRVMDTSESLHFRKNSKLTSTDEQVISAWQKIMGELIEVLSEKVQFLPLNLPRVDVRKVSPEQAAQMTRQALGLTPTMPVDHVIRSAEKLGVFVQTHGFDEQLHLKNHDASSTWCNFSSGASFPLIICRAHSSWERTRFSVAHELGHLVMHRLGGNEAKEDEANRFAGEFLIPAETLARIVEEPITLASLRPLKDEWGLSIQALIYRCFNAGLLNKIRKDSLMRQLSARKDSATGQSWRIREPGADSRKVERPMMLGSAIGKAYGKPPRMEELFADLPAENNNWFKSMLMNFDLQWSRELNAEMRLEAAALKHSAAPSHENVVSLANWRSRA